VNFFDITLPTPAANLACDEALLERSENAGGAEVLRFWESPELFVVVGYANKVVGEVNMAACEARGIPIYRRCSGGGPVVQGPGCLNYALVLRITAEGPTRNISAANRFIMGRNCAAVQSAIGHQKSVVCVQGHTDLTMDGLKFSGNSQRRRRRYLLFHGTFLLNFDLKIVGELLPVPSKQPDYRQGRSHGEFLRNLRLNAEEVKAALRKVWCAFGAFSGDLGGELEKLVERKYSRPEWNLKF